MSAGASFNRRYTNKRILITQNQLINFAGSEIVTLEIAEYFSRHGAEVLVATNSLGNPMMEKINELRGVTTYILPSEELDGILEDRPADFAWIHHQLIPKSLFSTKSLAHTKYVFHHMSPYHPTEFPIFSNLESDIADAVLFNSPETEKATLEQGVLKNIKGLKDVFGNPAPDSFLRVGGERIREGAIPTKIMIVSNHVVPELAEARDILQSKGITVLTYGAQTSTYKLLAVDDFHDIDLVITIGKTVQYAILYGMPVYCYDHFGGPGYITAGNYESSLNRNFSGRNGDKKDAATIVDEILENYIESRDFFVNLGKDQIDRFRLSSRIDSLYSRIFKYHIERTSIDHSQVVGLAKVNELNKIIQEVLRSSDREYHDLQSINNDLERRYLEVSSMLGAEQARVRNIYNSKPYKLGRLITMPVRFLKNLFIRR